MVFVFVDNAKGDITKSELPCQHKTCWSRSSDKNTRSFFLFHNNPLKFVAHLKSKAKSNTAVRILSIVYSSHRNILGQIHQVEPTMKNLSKDYQKRSRLLKNVRQNDIT